MMAPVAIQQADLVAKNIDRLLRGQRPQPFSYSSSGTMVTIGRRAAVANVFGLQLSGLVAWVLWLTVHLYWLIGFRNRLLVLINWIWTMLRATDSLERAFAGPPARDERAQKERARRALVHVAGLLAEHCGLMEQPGGLVAEVELKLGRSDNVTEVRRMHEQLVHDADALLAAMGERHDSPRADVQRRAQHFIKTLRVHLMRQTDLLIEKYNRDIGGESGKS
jgi:hypothetical protein